MRLFGDRLYVELQRHGLAAGARRRAARWSSSPMRSGLPLVATNEPYFATADDYEAHDALLCIAEGRLIAEPERRHLTPEHRFKTRAEMVALFADLPEALATTVEIAQRCAFRPQTRKPILPRFTASGGRRDRRGGGAARARPRRGSTRAARRRTASRPATPRRTTASGSTSSSTSSSGMKYPGYFLIVADFIKWAKAQGIPVGPGPRLGRRLAGRLGAHHHRPRSAALRPAVRALPQSRARVDAGLRHRLLPGPARRGDPLRAGALRPRPGGADHHLRHAAGARRAARRRPRAGDALRPGRQAVQAGAAEPGRPGDAVDRRSTASRGCRRRATTSRWWRAPARRSRRSSKGLHRHASTHAAGIVIGDRPLDELVPLYRDPKSDMPVTQFNMKWVEQAGLVKFDFLGLKTLTVLETRGRAAQAARHRDRSRGDPARRREDLRACWRRGETVGVFQVESAGHARGAASTCSPTASRTSSRWSRSTGRARWRTSRPTAPASTAQEQPDYLHPKLEPILKETYGVIVYQEQVMQIAQVLAGYSLGEADLLRRAMGKKIQRRWTRSASASSPARSSAASRRRRPSAIFELLGEVRRLRLQQEPRRRLCAGRLPDRLPEGELSGRVPGRLDDARHGQHRQARRIPRRGVAARHQGRAALGQPLRRRVRRRRATRSSTRWRRSRASGAQAVEAIVAARGERPFADLADFARRINPRAVNKRVLESLAAAGAFDCIERDRARAAAAVDVMLAAAQRAHERATVGQSELFGGPAARETLPLPAAAAWLPAERCSGNTTRSASSSPAIRSTTMRRCSRRLRVQRWSEFARAVKAGATAGRVAATVVSRRSGAPSPAARWASSACPTRPATTRR